MDNKNPTAENVILDIMRHFGFRRNYQVAEYFNVTPQTLSGWIKAGEIPAKHMMKYTKEVLNNQTEKSSSFVEHPQLTFNPIKQTDKGFDTQKFSWIRTKLILNQHSKTLIGIPFSADCLIDFFIK